MRLSALVAGAVAVFAALAVIEVLARHVVGTQLQLHELLFAGSKLRLALGADFSDQALGDDAFNGRGDEERLQAQVQQSGDRAGGVVGVQGAEHQVARQGRLHGDFGCLLVADFADQDHVGILTQHRTQDAGESQLDIRLDLALDDAVDVVLDRDPRR